MERALPKLLRLGLSLRTTSSERLPITLPISKQRWISVRCRREIYMTGQSRSVTRSVSARRQFVAGQAVFWRDPGDNEWAGTILQQIRTDFNNEFEIQLHRNMVDGGEVETRTVHCSEISPDLGADGLGDDDDYELLIPSSAYDTKFAVGGTNGVTQNPPHTPGFFVVISGSHCL